MKLYDIVKWDPEGSDGENVLVYKHEAEDFNTHTQLIVHASQEAIFFKDGRDLDVFDAGRHTLSSDNLPVLKKLINIPTGGETPFHCEVYFINKITLNDLKWGTQEAIIVQDPLEQANVHVRAHGMFGARISEGRKILRKVVGTRGLWTKTQFTEYLKAQMIERVKTALGQAMVMRGISVLQISAFISDLSREVQNQLAPFFDEYGMTLTNFSFNSILPLEEDLKGINESKIMRRKRALEGYTYQQEHSFDVLKSAAENTGTAGGMMGIGMGAGMGFGLGGAFGAGMGGMAQNLTTGGAAAGGAEAMQTCAHCGAKIPAGVKFCSTCGNEVVPPGTIVCTQCGTKLPAGSKFCFSCGTKLSNVCVKCGKELPLGANFCDGCGEPQK